MNMSRVLATRLCFTGGHECLDYATTNDVCMLTGTGEDNVCVHWRAYLWFAIDTSSARTAWRTG